MVTPLTNPAEVTDQGLYYCNSNAWGWHNSHKVELIDDVVMVLHLQHCQMFSIVLRALSTVYIILLEDICLHLV